MLWKVIFIDVAYGRLFPEVEKQLQGSLTPLLSYKKPHSGSTGNIHGMVLAGEQVPSVSSPSGMLTLIRNT